MVLKASVSWGSLRGYLCTRSQVFTAPGKGICSFVMSSPKIYYFISQFKFISRSHLIQNLQCVPDCVPDQNLIVYLHRPSEGQKCWFEAVFSIWSAINRCWNIFHCFFLWKCKEHSNKANQWEVQSKQKEFLHIICKLLNSLTHKSDNWKCR